MSKAKRSPSSWEKIIKHYEQSNLGKAEFCNKQNLRPSLFYYWCSKLRPDLKSKINVSRAKESLFLPIKTTKKEKSFSISLRNGIEIKFDSLSDPLWIAKLLKSVGELNDQH